MLIGFSFNHFPCFAVFYEDDGREGQFVVMGCHGITIRAGGFHNEDITGMDFRKGNAFNQNVT